MSADSESTNDSWSHHLSRLGRSLRPNVLATLGSDLVDCISLGGGNVHPKLFPMQHATFTIPALSALDGDLASWVQGKAPTTKIEFNKYGPGTESAPSGLFDLAKVLHYGHQNGYHEFVDLLGELNRVLHVPAYTDSKIYLTLGNLDAMSKVFQILLDPDVDTVLVERYCYAGALHGLKSRNIKTYSITADSEGLDPEDLQAVLQGWDVKTQGKRPHVLYMIPVGQNPTGSVLAKERYRRIFEICQRFDLIIIEDDLYFHLQYTPYQVDLNKRKITASQARIAIPSPPASAAEDDIEAVAAAFRSSLSAHSFLEHDTDGRVIRCDSASKTLGPGVGWITCNPVFHERLLRVAEISTQTTNNLGQAILASYLSDRHWGIGGFLRWMWTIRLEYQQKRNFFLDSFYQYCDEQYVTATPSGGGMYLWVRIAIDRHPRYKANTGQLMEELYQFLVTQAKVVVIPSRLFIVGRPNENMDSCLNYFRVCFSEDYDKLEKGAKAFGETVTAFFEQS